jgi:hypothetical protein
MKRLVSSVVLATLLALAVVIAAAPQREAEAAPPGAAWGVTAYNVTSSSASFSWHSSGWGTQQWVDLSFWNGSYWQWLHAGPLGTWANSYTWNSLQPNTTYYVRVNTGTWWGEWLASDWSVFTTTGFVTPCYSPTYNYPYGYGPSVITCPPTASGAWVRIWTQGGNGATYHVNQTIQVCYQVSHPMYIRIIDILANGAQQTFIQGYDDGRGDCLPGLVTPPTGLERMIIYGANGSTDSTYFNVVY